METNVGKIEIKHRKLLKSEIVDILSDLSDVELWMYKWASPELVNKKFKPIREKLVSLHS